VVWWRCGGLCAAGRIALCCGLRSKVRFAAAIRDVPTRDIGMATSTDAILAQIDAALSSSQQGRPSSRHGDSELQAYTSEIITRLAAAIDRLSPPNSQYRENAKSALKQYGPNNAYSIPILAGALRALREDYAAGHLRRVEQLVQADLFADFLEMAEHVLGQGYKDPAAVLVGGVLEEQLRKLCILHGVSTTSGGRPKKADGMNADLAGAGVYNKLDQKSVTAWLDLRNKAAHGLFGEYTTDQVGVFLQGVRDFATRHL
jgi:hypothetical protein